MQLFFFPVILSAFQQDTGVGSIPGASFSRSLFLQIMFCKDVTLFQKLSACCVSLCHIKLCPVLLSKFISVTKEIKQRIELMLAA